VEPPGGRGGAARVSRGGTHMADTTLGFGIVVCGLVSQFHGAAITNSPKAELIAAADLDDERLSAFVESYGGERAESFEALLADERIDVVNILTPNAMHARFAVPALEAGKHVIVEKPMAIGVPIGHMW